MINNPNNTVQYIYNTTNFRQAFDKLYTYINDKVKYSNEPLSTIFNDIKIRFIDNEYHVLHNENEYFIDEDSQKTSLNENQKNFLNIYVNDIIANSKYNFILSSSIKLFNNLADSSKISQHPQYTYKEIAYMNLFDIFITNPYYTQLLTNYKNKKILTNTYILNNGFVIENYSPFNGPHTIKAGTKLYGLLLDGNNIDTILNNLSYSKQTTILPENYNVYIRIVNWWDDTPKCVGTINLTPTSDEILNTVEYKNLNHVINSYDFIEKLGNQSTIRFNQNEYKKSNIYSIRIKNSGLNPNSNIIQNLQKIIVLKNYINLDETYQQLYNQITWQQIQTDIKLNNSTTMLNYYNDLLQLKSTSNIPYIQSVPIGTQDNPFTSEWKNYLSTINGYYKLDQDKTEQLQQIKIDLRNSLESAIRNSVSRYMPVQTKLWKIIYEGN